MRINQCRLFTIGAHFHNQYSAKKLNSLIIYNTISSYYIYLAHILTTLRHMVLRYVISCIDTQRNVGMIEVTLSQKSLAEN